MKTLQLEFLLFATNTPILDTLIVIINTDGSLVTEYVTEDHLGHWAFGSVKMPIAFLEVEEYANQLKVAVS